jgi:hypothetical protein
MLDSGPLADDHVFIDEHRPNRCDSCFLL